MKKIFLLLMLGSTCVSCHVSGQNKVSSTPGPGLPLKEPVIIDNPPIELTKRVKPPYELSAGRTMSASFPAPTNPNKPTVINISIDDSGNMIGPLFVTQSAGSLAADYACIDAVMSSLPIDKAPEGTKRVCTFNFYQPIKDLPYTFVSDNSGVRKSFLVAHPTLDSNVCLTRSIPLAIAQRYPKTFTKEELNSSKNIRVMNQHIFQQPNFAGSYTQPALFKSSLVMDRYGAWAKFIQSHPFAQRSEIEDEQFAIDKKYGAVYK